MRPGPGTCNRGGVRPDRQHATRSPFAGARYWLPTSIVLWAIVIVAGQQLATHWPAGWWTL